MTQFALPLEALRARLLDALPQTQCTRCGYPDCAGYADALATGSANINQCPPGGEVGMRRLAALTGRTPTPLDPSFGLEGPRHVVFIDENWCIGCTLCLDACPTDAIVGSNKMMHTVIEAYCTGCDLCLPVCPVDCIAIENTSGTATGWEAWSPALADLARNRYSARMARQNRDQEEQVIAKAALAQTQREIVAQPGRTTDPQALDAKKAIIEAAVARARQKKQPPPADN